ncbi:MAG: branched-chain amino acid ABC transporter ATP-binding protein/permease [Dehalococcoidia bacterium]
MIDKSQAPNSRAKWPGYLARKWQIGVAIFALVALPVVPYVNDPYWVTLISATLMAAYLNIVWNWAGGFAGLLSLGHAAFFGIGGYTAAVLLHQYDVNPWLGMVAGATVATVSGAAVALAAFRFKVRGFYFALLTFTAALVLPAMVKTSSFLGATEGIFLPLKDDVTQLQMFDRRFFFWTYYIMILVALVVTVAIDRSSLGRQLRAVKGDEDAAESLGVPAARLRVIIMSLSAGFTGLAGTVYTFQTLLAHTETTFDTGRFFLVIISTMIGGLGTVAGPLIGAFFLTGVRELIDKVPVSSQKAAAVSMMVYGLLLIGVGIMFPRGIVGMVEGVGGFIGSLPGRGRKHTATVSAAQYRSPIVAESAGIGFGRTKDDTPELVVTGLTKRFGGLLAVDDVSFKLYKGEIVVLIGPNGAGKSTILEICSGFLKPDAGVVTFKGKKISGQPPHKVNRMGIGRTFQKTRPFENLTILENVLVAAGLRSANTTEATAKAMECLRLVGLVPQPGPEALGSYLSTGQRKRLEIARVLATDAGILLVDEPFGGLDERSQGPLIDLLRYLRHTGCGIVLVEHKLSVVEAVADRVIALDSGRVIQEGTPQEVLQNREVIEAYLGGAGELVKPAPNRH